MHALWLAVKTWSSSVLVRYLGVYLIYLATALRLAAAYLGRPEQSLVLLLLAVYGALLILEPLITQGQSWRSWVYLLLQSAVVIGLQLTPPREEVVALLFIPLSLQAVILLGRRVGFAWIAVFALAVVEPVMSAWDWTPAGAVMVVFLSGIYFLMGRFAYIIGKAESARRENRRLIDELSEANSQLQAYAVQMEEYTALQERSRLARELHDSATQTIFSMNLTVQTARMLFERDRGRVAGQLDRLRELSESADAEIHVLVDRLRPSSGASEELPAALRRLVFEHEMLHELQISLEVIGEKNLSDPVVAGLSRIVQEALNNVAKHAGTRQAVVRLDLAGPRAILEVVDRGVGFDPGTVPAGGAHLGLSGMAERAAELGWRLSYDSRPGHGTRVRAEEA